MDDKMRQLKFKIGFLSLLLFLLLYACKQKSVSPINSEVLYVKSTNPELILLKQEKIVSLIPNTQQDEKFEASGIFYTQNKFYTIFDNRFEIAEIDRSLTKNDKRNSLIGEKGKDSEFEAITHSQSSFSDFFYVAIEAKKQKTKYFPFIRKYDKKLHLVNEKRIDFPITGNINKGVEGLACITINKQDYLLALYERSGKIVLLSEEANYWKLIKEISIQNQQKLYFSDYSDLAISKELKIAICSQENAKLWISELDTTNWEIKNNGTYYNFPQKIDNITIKQPKDYIYKNIEGISFINESTLVVCSDKAKYEQSANSRIWDQAIHIFKIPNE